MIGICKLPKSWQGRAQRARQAKLFKAIAGELSKKNMAHDVSSYKDAPPGFRFWCGPTIETEDIRVALMELEKLYNEKVKTV